MSLISGAAVGQAAFSIPQQAFRVRWQPGLRPGVCVCASSARARRMRVYRACAESKEREESDPEMMKQDLEQLFERSPSTWPQANEEPKSLGDIKDSGVERIVKAGEDMKSELSGVGSSNEEFAAQLVEEELNKVLKKFEKERETLLSRKKEQVEEIRKEATLLRGLAISAHKDTEIPADAFGARQKALLALAGLFGVAAMVFFWDGITADSSSSLMNASVDALFAALIAYFSQSSDDVQ